MKKKYMILLVAVGILLMVNVILTSLILSRPIGQVQCPAKSRSLPCEAMPIKFALDSPDCANKLLEAMNITNVKILPKNSTNTMIERVRARLQNNSYS